MYQRIKKETKQWIVTCITKELDLSTTLIDADTIPEAIIRMVEQRLATGCNASVPGVSM